MVDRKLKRENPMSMSGCCGEQEPCTIILEEVEKTEKPSFMNHQIQDFKDINIIKSWDI